MGLWNPGGIKVRFGDSAEADTVRTVFAPLVGWNVRMTTQVGPVNLTSDVTITDIGEGQMTSEPTYSTQPEQQPPRPNPPRADHRRRPASGPRARPDGDQKPRTPPRGNTRPGLPHYRPPTDPRPADPHQAEQTRTPASASQNQGS